MKLTARLRPIVFLSVFAYGSGVSAQDGNILAQCRSQSLDLDDIHQCMDGYLDSLDSSISRLTEYFGRSLSGASLVGLNKSQQAFTEFRRENCLWYLDFSSPRDEAEQIAKNCLADMTLSRFLELKKLVSTEVDGVDTYQGRYVFDAVQNTFQVCGSNTRFLVGGDPDMVSVLQQSYLTQASDASQELHATLVGSIAQQEDTSTSGEGVFELTGIISVRPLNDLDCGSATEEPDVDTPLTDVTIADNATVEEAGLDAREDQEPEQQLTAIFGSWLVDCFEVGGRKFCALEVRLSENGAPIPVDADVVVPKLVIERLPNRDAVVQLSFPDREVDTPTRILWGVDAQPPADILGSAIRVDQAGTRQLINQETLALFETVGRVVELHADEALRA